MTDYQRAIGSEVVPGATSLAELGALIDAPAWLDDGAVTVVDGVTGLLPVSWSPAGTVATVALPGDRAILYLALNEEFSAVQVAGGLRRAPGAERASAAIVHDAAVVRDG